MIMTGRLEKELASEDKMRVKLKHQPRILMEFYIDMKDNGKSYLTIDRYINHIIDFIKYVRHGRRLREDFYNEVDSTTIKQYMNDSKHKEVNGTLVEVGDEIRSAKWSALNLFFKFLVLNHYMDENPVESTKRPVVKTEHEVTYLEPEEVAALISNIKEGAKKKFKNRDLCIISLAISTGLRVGAICNLNIEDIDFKENKLYVIEKGRKKRHIMFGENMAEALHDWLKDRKEFFKVKDIDALFVSQKNTRISEDSVAILLQKYTKGITSKHITPHKLRATCAVNLYRQTKDLLLVADVLGHNKIETTQRYTCASEDSKKQAVQFLDTLI